MSITCFMMFFDREFIPLCVSRSSFHLFCKLPGMFLPALAYRDLPVQVSLLQQNFLQQSS